jgi:hypothetical protein
MTSSVPAAVHNPAAAARARQMLVPLVALVMLAVALRVMGLDRSLWIDEAGSLAQASAPDFWAIARHDVHPPLYSALLRLGLKLTSSVVALRLFSVACGLGTVVLAAVALRKSVHAMLVGGFVAAALPEFTLRSQQLRPYALLFLLLAIALALAVRVFNGTANPGTRLALMFVLLAAAATHLVTAFFLLALAPLLAWPGRTRGLQTGVVSLLPLLPAGLLLLWFKFGFVDQPGDLAEGWWMPRATPAVVLGALGDTIGWPYVQWLADAASRHVPGGGVLVRGLAIVAPLFAVWIAWARRIEPVVAALLTSALIYIFAIVAYSRVFEPVLVGRTLLPALLPLAAGLAWSIGSRPRAWPRTAATAAVALYVAFAALPVARLAFTPSAGLRGLAAVARTSFRPGDCVVLFRAMDYGLRPYWPDFSHSNPILFDQTRPPAPQLTGLDERLDHLAPDARVFLAYRDDFYFQHNRAAFDGVLAEFAAHGRPAHTLWHENDLMLLLASHAPSR